MKKNKINIVDNFSVVINEVIPDNKGNNLKVILYMGNKIIKDVDTDKLYTTEKEIILDYKYHIIPEYRASISNDIIDKLHTAESVTKFAINFIKKGTVKYGMSLDIVVLLHTYGYTEPDFKKAGYTIADYEKFINLVKRVSLEIKKQLNKLGFQADRNASNSFHHDFIEPYGKSMNAIYTRYPWGAGDKINKLVHNFSVKANKNHLIGTDMEFFSKHHPEVAGSLEDLNTSLLKLGGNFNKSLTNDFNKSATTFKNKLNNDIHSMVKFYKEQAPTMYVNYCKG